MTYGGAPVVAGPGWALVSLVAVVPWLWRRAGGRLTVRLAVQVAGAAYLALLVGLTFFPLPPYTGPPPGWADRDFINVMPLATIADSFSHGLSWPAIRLVVVNVVAFLPLGALVAWLTGRPSWRTASFVGLGVSTAIEAGQLGVSLVIGFPYRHADVDDVLLNVAGTAVGYLVTRAIARREP